MGCPEVLGPMGTVELSLTGREPGNEQDPLGSVIC